jgi:hypothetical protein
MEIKQTKIRCAIIGLLQRRVHTIYALLIDAPQVAGH